jgi:hypothetical protein
MIPVDIVAEDGTDRCVNVELRDAEACGGVEEGVATGDSAGVASLASKAFGLSPEDSATILSDEALAFDFCDEVLGQLRQQATPWFLQQFIGRRHQELVLKTQDAGDGIKAITGATISSAAVNESVRRAVLELESAAGFEEE